MTTDTSDQSTQFQLKHALAVLFVVSVWAALIRQPHLRSYGDLATLLLLCYFGPRTLRFTHARIRGFAERGLPSIASGITAATIGTFASLLYGTLLVDAFHHGGSALAPTVMMILGAMIVLGFWVGALLIVVALGLLTLADLFRRPLRSFPLIFAYNLFHAVIGSTMFVMFEFALSAIGAKPDARDPSLLSMGLLGGLLGFVFGSCGLHVHLDYAEDWPIRESPSLSQDGRQFES